jgi:hypothetical protein
MKKLMKYTKTIQNNPKFDQGVSNNVGWLQKNEAKKNKKTKISSPSASTKHSGKRPFPEC